MIIQLNMPEPEADLSFTCNKIFKCICIMFMAVISLRPWIIVDLT